LRTEYWRNVHANSRLRVAASDLFATLNAQGVIPMVLKGACQLFDPPAGHAGTRFMVDLDLLAPPGQDRLCYDTLHALGFVPHLDTASSHHLPKLTKPCAGLDDGLAVEIHNTPWFGGGAAEAEAFFAASIRLENTVGQALLPCTVHRLLHNAVHTFHHGGITYYGVSEPDLDDAIGCTDLKQLLDFADLLGFRGDGIDWTWLRAEADRFDRTFELQQWSFLARELFGVQLPPDLARWRVDREAPPTVQVQGRRAVRRVLRRAGLLDSARRLKRRWLG
jgi:hypothetical protein